MSIAEQKSYEQLESELHILRQTFQALEGEYDAALADADRRLKTMEALKYSSVQLAASMDLQQMLEEVLQVIFKLLPADNAHVFLYDGKDLSFAAMLRSDGPSEDPTESPRRHGLTYAVARSGESRVVEDARSETLFLDKLSMTSGALVGLPMKLGDTVVGVMNIGFKAPRTFSQEELDTLELFAMQTAIAVENVRLYQKSQADAQEMAALREQDKTYYEELNRTKDLLMDMVSHDLRNPIGIIKGYTSLLREHGAVDDDLGKHCLEQIESGAARILSLVTDLLDLAKLETGLALTLQPVPLDNLLGEVANHFTLAAQQKHIALALDIPNNGLTLNIDRNRMEQVFTNLVSNAIKYTPDGGNVRVVAEHLGGQVAVRIVDTGYGIAPEEVQKLFRKFYRVKNPDHADVEGTGLGLAIVKTIVEQHGGSIQVDSIIGQGSTFIVQLPA